MSIKELEKYNNFKCACGKIHNFSSKVITGYDILDKIPETCDEYCANNIFLLCDKNTFKAAGEKVIQILKSAGKQVTEYIYNDEKVVPDEVSVGKAVLNFNSDCDVIIGVGSGVINDIGKIVANVSNKPYFIVATAPSMDGYAAAGSSMERGGVKTTVKSKAPDVIIGDFNVLKDAPLNMMLSGLGDMLAKYVALCEWNIAKIIVGEYYCDEIASLVRIALDKCVSNADKLMSRDAQAVQAVFEGLIICGAAMEYAGISRPASGVEHYISHIIDMRSVALGTPNESHGIQCAIGTLYALKMYERLKNIVPDKEKAKKFVQEYEYSAHKEFLKKFLGKTAETLIALEKKEGKYSVTTHEKRLEIIINNWGNIISVIEEKMPSYEEILAVWKKLGGPVSLSEIGIDEKLFPEIFIATKDIRDKYVLSFLAWDLGETDTLLKEM
ncbi:MAG: sn-glycerol-1-phosphate dehydrogenase [Clostridia bacterium]|nr:sn-glycerol-1-phosphate dehydrogenase [Clostridia bacterium]